MDALNTEIAQVQTLPDLKALLVREAHSPEIRAILVHVLDAVTPGVVGHIANPMLRTLATSAFTVVRNCLVTGP